MKKKYFVLLGFTFGCIFAVAAVLVLHFLQNPAKMHVVTFNKTSYASGVKILNQLNGANVSAAAFNYALKERLYTHYEETYEYYYVEEYIRRPMVALTFDDGPAEPTGRILDILEYHNARATFFVLGRRVSGWPNTTLRIFESDNELAGHTFSHRSLPDLTDEQIINEITRGSAAIEAIIGEPPPPIFRPPGGRMDNRVVNLSREIGYSIIMWSLDPRDWEFRDVDSIYNRIIRNIREGDIIVLHDTHWTTAEAMERVIPSLIEMGFSLVTVSELIYHSNGIGPGAGDVYRRVAFNP